PVTVQVGTTLKSAITVMRDKRVDTLLVVDSKQELKGFIDLESINQHHKIASIVDEIKEEKVYTVYQDSILRDTVHKILRRGVKYVPVVDKQHRLVGIVTRATLANMVYDTIWGDGIELEQLAVAE